MSLSGVFHAAQFYKQHTTTTSVEDSRDPRQRHSGTGSSGMTLCFITTLYDFIPRIPTLRGDGFLWKIVCPRQATQLNQPLSHRAGDRVYTVKGRQPEVSEGACNQRGILQSKIVLF